MNLATYYQKRANEYENIYNRDDPVTKAELIKLATNIKSTLKNRDVIEIACGTGYWTQILSESAKSITATDIIKKVLEIANSKKYNCPVTFTTENAYNLSYKDKSFEGGLANLWFSHIPVEKVDAFLNKFHRVLKKNAAVFIADNNYVTKIGGKLIIKSKDKNTYKQRLLKNGRKILVLKNYYTPAQLLEIFQKYTKTFNKKNIFYGKFFWYVTYHLNK